MFYSYHDISNINTSSSNKLVASLYEAVRLNDSERLQTLLKSNKTHNDQEHMSMALHMAAQRGHVECGSTLIQAGVNPDAHNSGGYTALILAARHGHADFIKLLVKENCNLQKTVYQTGANALHWAASCGKMDCARVLIEAGCKVDAKSLHGWTPLMVAASNDEISLVNLLLDNGADPEARDIYKGTALHIAASEGALISVEDLLSLGIDVNIKDKFGKTPLHNAARHCQDKAISILIKEKCDVNVTDTKGLTPLHYSALYDNPACARELLNGGADPKVTVNKTCQTREDVHVQKGTTALMIACERNAGSVVRILFEYPETLKVLDAKDSDGRTALQHACSNGHCRCISVLLDAGADPDGVDTDGPNCDKSPLNLAISSKSFEAVKTLVLGNCSISESNILNAMYAEDLEMAKLLIMAQQGALSSSFLVSASCDPSCMYQDNIYDFLSWAESFIHARTLLHTCRCFVRNLIGSRNISKMSELPLPGQVIQYVGFRDLNDLNG
ncbi:ankyrin-3-like isoform X2 [Lineus longissimus]|uniref:ankyrin-3-like isoform X2 n=1 Tax=Lineus longissimus TaxID=88925 RepID=UPI002B4C3FA5